MEVTELPMFRGLPRSVVEAALPAFTQIDAASGDVLMVAGEHDPTAVFVLSGELEVSTGATPLGFLRAGQIAGEAALFADGVRTADVCANQPTRMLVLSRPGYRALARAGSLVAVQIEELALEAVSARLRRMSARIAEASPGRTEARTRGWMSRLAAAWVGVAEVRVDVVEALAQSALFAGAPIDALRPIAAACRALRLPDGTRLCEEGGGGDEMFVVVSGEVEVTRRTRAGREQPLSLLRHGDAFGVCALVQPDEPRSASCVARGTVVVLTLGPVAWAELVHRADAAGSALRVALIRSMARSLAYANAQLATLGHAQQEAADEAIRARAGAGLEVSGAFVRDPTPASWYETPS
jgi:CRP/FNR family cyclic AMP-dependent transcriptional regulator